MRLFPTHVRAIIAVAYAYGFLLGCLSLLWSWASGRSSPQLEWWQYLLAPFALGLAAFILEATGTFLTNGFTFGQTASAARISAGRIVLVVLLVLLLMGWPVYQITQQ
jgi:hypothetical protein